MRGLVKNLFSGSAGPIVPGLFSVGSWFVSQFFHVPFDEGIFRAGAILGMLAGYALGNVSFGGVVAPRRVAVALSIVGALAIGVTTMVDYYFFVGGGHVADNLQTLRAVAELALVFACAGYLMPIAGIDLAKAEESEGPKEP